MKKDYWKELHNLKNKTPDDTLLAEVFLEMKKKSTKDARKAKIKATREHYLKEKKPEPLDETKPLS